MVAAIIADTHLPTGRRRLPDRCVELLGGADLILHAGDLSDMEALDRLRRLGPPLAVVHGNVDSAEVRAAIPPEQTVEAGGANIGLIHDAGPARGRLERMRRRFPGADAVVFGHSHIPLHDEARGFQIFNPGSPTDRRRAPAHTMGLATIEDGAVRFELVTLD